MKKVIFITCALAIGLWSCSDSNETDKLSEGYANVTIGIESGNHTLGVKTIVASGGGTSWNLGDKVKIIDVDGVEQEFSYAAETPKSSASFTGKLKSGQGPQVYRAYHAAKESNMTLKNGYTLVVERKDIAITQENGSSANYIKFGSYCPMIAMPAQFDVESEDDSKLVQFHHLSSMIEGRVTLRELEDSIHRGKLFDKVEFKVEATDGSKPFHKMIELDLAQLTVSSTVTDLKSCITNMEEPETLKTDVMTTTIDMSERTIGKVIDDSKDHYYPIPIFALPTANAFSYKATVCFYHKGIPVLTMSGLSKGPATGLNPAGLNILDFDHDKIVL